MAIMAVTGVLVVVAVVVVDSFVIIITIDVRRKSNSNLAALFFRTFQQKAHCQICLNNGAPSSVQGLIHFKFCMSECFLAFVGV
jgi:hypothetical protein